MGTETSQADVRIKDHPEPAEASPSASILQAQTSALPSQKCLQQTLITYCTDIVPVTPSAVPMSTQYLRGEDHI